MYTNLVFWNSLISINYKTYEYIAIRYTKKYPVQFLEANKYLLSWNICTCESPVQFQEEREDLSLEHWREVLLQLLYYILHVYAAQRYREQSYFWVSIFLFLQMLNNHHRYNWGCKYSTSFHVFFSANLEENFWKEESVVKTAGNVYPLSWWSLMHSGPCRKNYLLFL